MDGPSLQQGLDEAGSAVALLWRTDPPVWAPPVVAAEYDGWRAEQHAWHERVTISDLSYHMWDTFIEGPDALRLLCELSANDYRSFAIGQAKQFLPVTEEGLLVIDGILTRDGDERFTLSGVPPAHTWVRYHAETGGYDVTCRTDPSMEFRRGERPALFRMQLQGPLAGELVERAFGAPLPETRFFHSTPARLAGRDFRALRHGMSGQPGWELIGDFADHDAVKDALLAAGEPLGLAHIGSIAYPTGGVESGWVPCPMPAIYTSPALADYRRQVPLLSYEGQNPLHGTWYSEDIEDYYRSPYELGYGRFVSFDHDFIGREALEKMKADGRDGRRKKVTFVWNGDDTAAAYGSMFHEGPGAKFINLPMSLYDTFHADRIEVDGKVVGMSTWTGYSANERAILSLGTIDAEFAKPGTEVTLIWGEDKPSNKAQVEDHVPFKIRATVQNAPLFEKARTVYRSDAGVK